MPKHLALYDLCLGTAFKQVPAMQAIDRRERLRRLALETIDLSKDPYFMRNHLGQVQPHTDSSRT